MKLVKPAVCLLIPLLLINFSCMPASGLPYEDIVESYSCNEVTTDELQEVIHYWINNNSLPAEEYEVELVKDVPIHYYGNLSYLAFTKTKGDPVDTKDLMIVTFNPNARGNQTRVIMPNVINTKSLSFTGVSPFRNLGNFPTTGQFFGEFIWQSGMTIIADEYSNFEGAVWNPDSGDYVLDPDGHITGMQAMFADWGNNPADPSDDSLHPGDVVSIMLIDTSKDQILFEKEVIVSGHPSYPMRLANGRSEFNMSSSVDDGIITLEYLGGTPVYPESIAIEVSHGMPQMNGFVPIENISCPLHSPLIADDCINISFNNQFSYNSNNHLHCNLLADQVICEGEVFRLSIIDNSSDMVLDSELLVMGGGIVPNIVDQDPVTTRELQTWIHHWLNSSSEPSVSPSADFHVEVHKNIDTEYGNLSYLSIRQTAGDTILTKDLKIITTNPNARGENKTREIIPNINNTKTITFTGVSPFLNLGNFPARGQFFGEFVLESGLVMVADEYSNYEGAVWYPDMGDYTLGPNKKITGMQAMFADWGDDPADSADDSLVAGDEVNVKIIYTPTHKVLFDEDIVIDEYTEPDYPYQVADFDSCISVSNQNITLVYEGGYPLCMEHIKILCTAGELPVAEILDKSDIAFDLSDTFYEDAAIDKILLNEGDVIEIKFSKEEIASYDDYSDAFLIGDIVLHEGDPFTLMVVDTDTGQVVSMEQLELVE